MLLGNGDGTFQAPLNYGSGGYLAVSVAVGDVNLDGKSDLIVANLCVTSAECGGILGVLLGNGDGTFSPAATYSSGGHNASSVVAVDVNGDQKPRSAGCEYVRPQLQQRIGGCTTEQHHSGQVCHVDFAYLKPKSFCLRSEGGLDGDGYLLQFNHADGESEVHMEWLHDWFGNAQQQRRGDPNQVQSQR